MKKPNIGAARKRLLGIAATVLLTLTLPAQATVWVVWTQDGANVKATYGGTLGIDAVGAYPFGTVADYYATTYQFNSIPADPERTHLGTVAGLVSSLSGIVGASLGPASSGSGDTFQYINSEMFFVNALFGPVGFTADTYVSGELIWNNRTLENVNAIFADPLTVLATVGGDPLVVYTNTPPPVPEPSSILLLLGAGLLFAGKRHRRLARPA